MTVGAPLGRSRLRPARRRGGSERARVGQIYFGDFPRRWVRIQSALTCTGHRVSLSPYCRQHYAAQARNGHPTAPPVRDTLWVPYRSRVRALLETNNEHPGVSRALDWVRQWLSLAVAMDGHRGYAWATEAARLSRHGISPLDLLTELGAVYVALQEHPHATQSDMHRAFAMSKAVLSLAPRPRRVTREAAAKGSGGYAPKPRPAALRHIGPHLTQGLAPLLSNLVDSLQREEELALAEVDRLRKPLRPSPDAIQRALQGAPHSQPTHCNGPRALYQS